MQATYEFEMWRGDKQWIIEAFELDAITQGVDVGDACESAADLLREIVIDSLLTNTALPAASFENTMRHGGMPIIVSVEASLANVDRVSALDAAKALQVTRARVTAMIKSGLLDGWREGRNTWITRSSLEARLSNRRPAGRPKKSTVA